MKTRWPVRAARRLAGGEVSRSRARFRCQVMSPCSSDEASLRCGGAGVGIGSAPAKLRSSSRSDTHSGLAAAKKAVWSAAAWLSNAGWTVGHGRSSVMFKSFRTASQMASESAITCESSRTSTRSGWARAKSRIRAL